MSFWDNLRPAWLGGRGTVPSGAMLPPVNIRHGIGFIPLNGQGDILRLNTNTSNELFDLLTRCSPLAAIIGRKAEAFANGCVEVLNRSTQNYVRGTYKDWERLLDKPNPLQTRTAFLKQLYTYMMVQGWCFVKPVYAVGFENEGRPSQLWVLPPWCIRIELITGANPLKPGKFRRIWFEWDGRREELNEDELLLFSDNTGVVDKQTWLPQSRLRMLSMPIANIISAMDARNNLINKRGAIGFLSNVAKDAGDTVPMTQRDKEEVQRDFQGNYGITGDRWLYPITKQAMQWQQIALNVKELALHEEHKACIEDLCDGLGFPFVLLSNGKGATFSNQTGADTDLYQNTILPEAANICEQLNEGLKTADNNIEITISYDHIEPMQAGAKEKADVRKLANQARLIEWLAGLITLNEWRMANGDDTIKGEQYDMRKPEYDQYLADNGLAPQVVPPATGAEETALQNGGQGTATQAK